MSRIVLKTYDNGEPHLVVGWDRPCSSYFWQEFNKEPEVKQTEGGMWQVTSYAHKVRVYSTEEEAEEHKWDDWEEMVAYKGYVPSELATMQMFMDSLPRNIEPLVTEEVKKLLQQHSMDANSGNISVDMTTSNVMVGSYKVEVQTVGDTNWDSNAVRFATIEEAEQAGMDLAMRWTGVERWRVATSMDPVNYKWRDGKAVSV